MSDSESTPSLRNGLHSLAAAGAVLLGILLLAGAAGHLVAVWPTITTGGDSAPGHRLALLLPGLMLGGASVANLALCWGLWTGGRRALHWALVVNLVAAFYFGALLVRGVPGHPIGLFVAATTSIVLLLLAARAGLIWPAPSNE